MKVLTVFAHPNPKSFCRAILEQFTRGLEEADHTSEVVDSLFLSGAGNRRRDQAWLSGAGLPIGTKLCQLKN